MSASDILLVEDDRDVREAIAEVLEQEGYVVSMAKTGLEAVQYLKSCTRLPIAILLDLMMPVMDGWEFWAVQQEQREWAAVPVVIISADINVGEKARSLRALAYLRKPLDIDQLLEILGTLRNPGSSAPPALASTGAP